MSRLISQPRRSTRILPEPLEARRLFASDPVVIFDSSGFEPPDYSPGPLEGQDLHGPWQTDSLRTGVAQVTTNNVASGVQAVRMTRPGASDGDTRYGVVKPLTPAGDLQVVRISWDMNVPQNLQAGVAFGPFFGAEAYAEPQGGVRLIGSLGVDATTGDILFQDGTTGYFTETGSKVAFGAWNNFILELDYATDTYSFYVNGDIKGSTGFVDDPIDSFSDAPLAALAATADTKNFATGTAFFDNYKIELTPFRQPQLPAVTQVYVSSTQWTGSFKQYLEDNHLGDQYGYAIPATDQLNELPWTNVNQINIHFSRDVQVDADDLQIRGVNVANYALDPAGFNYNSTTHTATWTLAGTTAFQQDKILLDLNGDAPNGVKASNGSFLDGEWVNGGDTYPSGNGIPGGDFRFRINMVAGDVNRNGGVDVTDTIQTRNRQGQTTNNPSYSVFYDVNGDGGINVADTILVRNRQSRFLPPGEPTSIL